jgi:hypothetical protein
VNIANYLETALPPSPEREEVLELVRLGLSFQKEQRIGRRPGPFKAYLLKLVRNIEGSVTFDRLLDELELEAARRDMYGEKASPIEKVNRVWEIITYHHPRNGCQQLTFKTARNKLTWCKLNANK